MENLYFIIHVIQLLISRCAACGTRYAVKKFAGFARHSF
jgi:hypothetical protein